MGMAAEEQAKVQEFFDEVEAAGWESPSDKAWIQNIIYRAYEKGVEDGWNERVNCQG